jgi:PleD family two-component response regulator
LPLATFSAGVAVHPVDAPPAATLTAADAALYRAKADGRDCVRTPEPAGEGAPLAAIA